MDDQFHDIICDMSGHAVISDTLVPLHRKTRRYRKASIADAKRTAQVVKEHRAIYEAIAAAMPMRPPRSRPNTQSTQRKV